MALVRANAALQEPEIRLTQALKEYDAILSEHERIQLRSQAASDAMAAINLATLIDSRSHDGRRQCMGPRLITFLESIHHFTEIVDTFVTPHPTAALVWGGVKMALLVRPRVVAHQLCLIVVGCKQQLVLF